MALCKTLSQIRTTTSATFDETFGPGLSVRYEGIYVCVNCGLEVVGMAGKTLPDSRKQAHFDGCSAVKWRLLVAIASRPQV
jgi:hypothetical protein